MPLWFACNEPWTGRTVVSNFDERRPKEMPELDRRVLDAARREHPPTELSARMAGALGLSPLAVLAATERVAAEHAKAQLESSPLPTEPKPQTTVALKGNGSPFGAASLWGGWAPWGAGVALIAVGGALVASQVAAPAPPAEAKSVVAGPSGTVTSVVGSSVGVLPLSASVVPNESRPTHVVEPPASDKTSFSLADKTSRAGQSRTPSDLSAEIARMDAARGAMAAGTHALALDLLRQYEVAYPRGSFRPEAAALRIECLVKLGRTKEARSLAERFVRQHRGSRLADRVAQLTGLAEL